MTLPQELPRLEDMPSLPDTTPYSPHVVQHPDRLTDGLPHGTQFAIANIETNFGEPGTLQVVVAVGHRAVQTVQSDERFTTSDGQGLRRDPEIKSGSVVLYNEGDAHSRLRKPLSNAMTPKALERIAPRTRTRLEAMVDEVGTEPFDAARYLGRIVAEATGDLLGVGPDQGYDAAVAERLSHMATATQGATDAYDGRTGQTFGAFGPVFGAVLGGQAAEGSVGHSLRQAFIEGELTEFEAGNLIATVPIAGIRTQKGGLEFLLRSLAEGNHLGELMANPAKDQNATLEALRRGSPLRLIVRGGPAEFEGLRTVACQHSANHDRTVWSNPYKFDIRRSNLQRHTALGTGVHRCVGAQAARLTQVTLIEVMRDKGITDVALNGDPIVDTTDPAI
ncbi:MAG TPA: hypothetical protein VLF43_05470, partial [Candidatus Saccharimonadales bacterium]|nr:hypothetical protein [Candidatus Saccharimonadales bacterium]